MKNMDAKRHCENCQSLLHGRYCSRCGQDCTSPIKPVRQALIDAVADILSFDSRILKSLKVLCQPGRLPARYVGGERVGHVPPFRMALSVSLVLFLVVTLVLPDYGEPTAQSGLAADLSFVAREHALALVLAQLLTLPPLALLLGLLYRRRHLLFLAHLGFTFYYHAAFNFVLIGLFAASPVLPTETLGYLTLSALFVVLGPYLFFALKAFYRAGFVHTLLSWPLLALSHLALMVLSFLAVVGIFAWIPAW
ncbi:DUF3667 domain-containing protein [Aquisalinus flavus]|uniref:DUF3667 domain-containing protein n=2 Tax=Aquisalinus flavus TaxID=1526572 RepID=UPI001E62671D|nr:DUF3667 domain-containing protein [Aquisalinus flavus]